MAWYRRMNRAIGVNGDERGVCLAELLIAAALMSLLIAAMLASFAFMAKNYRHLVDDLEMRQQMRFALESVSGDIAYAKRAVCFRESLEIYTDRGAAAGKELRIIYALDQSQGAGRLMKDRQPVTGTGGAEHISITRFHTEIWKERTVFITLEGMHRVTGKTFALKTASTMLNKKKTIDSAALESAFAKEF